MVFLKINFKYKICIPIINKKGNKMIDPTINLIFYANAQHSENPDLGFKETHFYSGIMPRILK